MISIDFLNDRRVRKCGEVEWPLLRPEAPSGPNRQGCFPPFASVAWPKVPPNHAWTELAWFTAKNLKH